MERLQLLISLLIASSIVVFSLPLFDMVYLYPATTRLLHEKVRKDAEHLGAYLAGRSSLAGTTAQPGAELLGMVESFELVRASLRSPAGEVLFSSDSEQLGQRRDLELFRRALQRGEAFSRMFAAQRPGTLEARNLIETQSPILRAGELVAVLELIHDVSVVRGALERSVTRASVFLFSVACLLLLVILWIARLARQAVGQQVLAEQLLQQSQHKLEIKHQELNRVFKQVELAKYEWQLALDCISDMILLVDAAGKVRRCNEALIRFVDRSYLAVLGKDWQGVLFTGGAEVLSLTSQRHEIYHARQKVWLLIEFYPYEGSSGEVLTVIRINQKKPREGVSAA